MYGSPPRQELEPFEFSHSRNPSEITPDKLFQPDEFSQCESSAYKSQRNMKTEERQRHHREAQEEYEELLKEMEEDENVTQEEIDQFKKNILIKKSIQEVKKRALEMKNLRASPQRFHKVQSKLGKQTNNKVAKKELSSSRNCQSLVSLGGSQRFGKVRQNPFDITSGELQKAQQKTQTTKETKDKQNERESQIQECEDQLNMLLKEMHNQKTVEERLNNFKEKQALLNNYFQEEDQIQLQQDEEPEQKAEDIKEVEEQLKEEEVPNEVPIADVIVQDIVQVEAEVQSKPQPAKIVAKKSPNKKVNAGLPTASKKAAAIVPPIKVNKQTPQKETVAQRSARTKVEAKKSPSKPKVTKNLPNKKSPEKAQKQEDNILKTSQTENGTRVDLKPPEGTDGCVMFIEKKPEEKIEQEKQTQFVVNNKKKQAVNSQFNGVPQQQQQPIQEIQQVVEEKAQSLQISSDQISEGIHGYDNFGVLAKKESKKIEAGNLYSNQELEDKTSKIQEEFDQLLQELQERRKDNDFYKVISEFYKDGNEAHLSPTKRLIQQKNTTFEHKITMKDNIEKGDYAFTYTTGPQKSYVIEPHGGEINYKMAQKDPLKFYDSVYNQDITKHTVGQDKEIKKQREEEKKKRIEEGSPIKKSQTKVPVTVKTKVTKRPHQKIMDKIQQKIALQLQAKFQELGLGNILFALKDQEVEDEIKDLVKQNKLQIVDQKNKVVYEKELKEEIKVMKKAKTQVESQKEDSERGLEEDDSLRLELEEKEELHEFKNSLAETKTHLQIADKDMRRIYTKVRKNLKK